LDLGNDPPGKGRDVESDDEDDVAARGARLAVTTITEDEGNQSESDWVVDPRALGLTCPSETGQMRRLKALVLVFLRRGM